MSRKKNRGGGVGGTRECEGETWQQGTEERKRLCFLNIICSFSQGVIWRHLSSGAFGARGLPKCPVVAHLLSDWSWVIIRLQFILFWGVSQVSGHWKVLLTPASRTRPTLGVSADFSMLWLTNLFDIDLNIQQFKCLSLTLTRHCSWINITLNGMCCHAVSCSYKTFLMDILWILLCPVPMSAK